MSFNPIYPIQLEKLPPQADLKDADFLDILLKARIELAELKGAAGQLPNPLLLTAPLLIRESVESSGIENINTTVSKVLESQLLPDREQNKPDKEVLNYRAALHWGMSNLNSMSLSDRLILGVHKILLQNNGGYYRREQNQIINSLTGEILYTPPVCTEINELIGNLEKYANDNKDLDPLIRAAIVHQQFESIHPFLDGNGRTGRILMVLQLVRDEVLSLPILFISQYINKNKNEYYKLLRGVNTHQEWKDYISFMLNCFYIQAKETKETLNKIVDLNRELKQEIKTKHPNIYSIELMDSLFSFPLITATQLSKDLDIHFTTAMKYLKQLGSSGILKSMKVGRNHFYINTRLVDLLSK